MTHRFGMTLVASLGLLLAACTSSSHGGAGADTQTFAPVPSSPSTARSITPDLPKDVLVSVPVSGGPLKLAVGYGSLWITSHRGDTLYRLDPRTDKITARIDIGAESCGTPAIGYGRVWVSDCDFNTIVVDPDTDQVVGSAAGGSLAIALAAGKVWADDPVDPRTLRRTARLGLEGTDAVSGGGCVWFTDASTGLVKQVDPTGDAVMHTYRAGGVGSDENYAGFLAGSLWISAGDERVWQIDPRTHSVTVRTLKQLVEAPHPGADTLAVTFSDGSMWVRGGAKVYRFALPTLRYLGSYPAADETGGFTTVAFGSLWVANVDADTVWRVRLSS